MLRRTGLTITVSILAVLVLVLALQIKEPDSALMRFLNLRTASRQLQRGTQARQAFPSIVSQASSFSSSDSKMASSSDKEGAPESIASKDAIGSESQDGGAPLGLPAPPGEGEAIQLDMSSGGDTVRLDSLGPMVVNKDGSISRIGNWDQMTEMEQKNTLRIVGKRNKSRMEALQAAEDGTAEDK